MAFSNTTSLDVADVAEYAGPVIDAVPHPSMFRVTAQVLMTGGTSSTVIVCGQPIELVHPSVAVQVRSIEYCSAHGPGVMTST